MRHTGFEVHPVASGRAALEAVESVKPDLVVLDVMLPDLDGFEVCHRLRSSGNRTPVLFLTARDGTDDKVRGLTMGGDDLSRQEDLSEAMGRTEQEAIRMGSLVQDLLDLARLDQGRPLQLEPVDLAVVLADAALDAGAVEPGRPVSVDAAVPVMIVGDDAMLRQIVANLVANAWVHTTPDTAVHLRARVDGDRAILEVADDGPGMSPEVAARAFERFYRADPARTRHTGGSGLGLSIVAATVTAHGGEATLHTALGEGTTIRLSLPILPPSRAEVSKSTTMVEN